MQTDYALSGRTKRSLAQRPRSARSWRAVARRVRAVARLIGRWRRDRRNHEDLRHLDDRTLRDLGMTRAEIGSVVAELGGRVAATRRRIDLDAWVSAASRFRLRAVDLSQ